MTLQKYIDSLPKEKQFVIAIQFVKLALPIWTNYADKNTLIYRDTVVGMMHAVDKKILKKSIKAIEAFLNINEDKIIDEKLKLRKLSNQFDDPIAALQDSDWEPPYEVQMIFYAVYNLIRFVLGKETTSFNESIIYVSINQAVDALETSKTMTFDELNKILNDIKNGC